MSTDLAREAEALRTMLELLDQIEETMNDAAWSEKSEGQIVKLRAQWTKELRAAERELKREWIGTARLPV